MPLGSQRFQNTFFALLVLVAAAGWLYVAYNQHRSNSPVEIVRKHFIFYPEYSHGVWRDTPCLDANKEKCREVTYSVLVKGCGEVNFDWRVFPGAEDADTTWSYYGPSPKIDENQYPLFAVLNEDSRLIDSPALGKPLPGTCELK